MVGSGNSCRVETSKGNIIHKYEECVCSSNYQTPCSGNMLIDGSDYCRYNNTIYTRENNCESSCDQTRETNVDSYLYGKAWHCLYEKDGAIIKSSETELCYNPSGVSTEKDKDYFDECAAQGYVKSKADCYISDLILYCPNDSNKVWCLEGKYCTGFNVGSNNYGNACNVGANVDYCDSKDKGIRCSYKLSSCNNCWNDGIYTGACSNQDTSVNGDSEKCCKLGYRMVNGICTKNVCDKTKFPYQMRPDGTIGEVETCYEGDESASLGYKAYFGYKSCKSDESKGEMWMKDPSNPRKCVCNRTSDTLGHLPYDLEDYFNTNGDSSNYGFNSGYYGEYRSCSDPDGTYYGYTLCYIGRTMSSKGICAMAGRGSYDATYPMGGGNINNALQHWGLPTISIPSEPRSSEQAYCVHNYTHCKSRDGTKLGDDDVCALVPSGCDRGFEAACNHCYHKASVIKGNDGLYHVNPNYLITINSYWNSSKLSGIPKCPSWLQSGGSRKTCYNYCYTSNLSNCFSGDVLINDSTSTKLGVVYYNSGNTIWLHSKDGYRSGTWNNAKDYCANYAPSGFETHTIYGKGKWRLAPYGQTIYHYYSVSTWAIRATFYKEGFGMSSGTWVDSENGGQAYYQPYGDGARLYLKESSLTYSPVLIFNY